MTPAKPADKMLELIDLLKTARLLALQIYRPGIADAIGLASDRLTHYHFLAPDGDVEGALRGVGRKDAAIKHVLDGALSLPRFAEDELRAALATPVSDSELGDAR